MPTFNLRAWGTLDWLIPKFPNTVWSMLGCLSTEERCLGLWEFLRARQLQSRCQLIEVIAPQSRFTSLAAQRRHRRRGDLNTIGLPSDGVPEVDLFARDSEIVSLADSFADSCGPSVIVDITCLPKRFFFALIHRLMQRTSIENLLVAYTVPEGYHGGVLAEDHQPYSHLPLFGPRKFPEPPVDTVVVGVGFVPLGLHELLQFYKEKVAIRALLSFPPGLPGFLRNWDFIRELESGVPQGWRSPARVEAYDVSDIFDHIVGFTNGGAQHALLAPFGPKTMSLAMCLYARLSDSPVYYTQPTVYHPDYSVGVRRANGLPLSYLYCLRVGGRDLYRL